MSQTKVAVGMIDATSIGDAKLLQGDGAWVTPAVAGWAFVEAASPSGASTTTFSHTVAAGYDYILQCRDMINAADIAYASGPRIRYGTGATPTFQTSGYFNQIISLYGTTANAKVNPGGTTGITILGDAGYGGSTANEPWDLTTLIKNPGANERTYSYSNMFVVDSDGNQQYTLAAGHRGDTAEVVTALQIVVLAGSYTGAMTLSRRTVA